MKNTIRKIRLLLQLAKMNIHKLESAIFFVKIQENHSMKIEVISNSETRFTFKNW